MQKLDGLLLLFFQKLATVLYNWIRIPTRHLAFMSLVAAGSFQITSTFYRILESFSILLILGILINIWFYYFVFKIYKTTKQEVSETLSKHTIFLEVFRPIQGVFGLLALLLLPVHFASEKANLHPFWHSYSEYEKIVLMAFFYFVSCKQPPTKKHPIAKFIESFQTLRNQPAM